MLFWPSGTYLSVHDWSTTSNDLQIPTKYQKMARESLQPHAYYSEAPELAAVNHSAKEVMLLRSPSIKDDNLSPLLVSTGAYRGGSENVALSPDKAEQIQGAPKSKWRSATATLTRSMSLSSESANTSRRTRRSTSLPCTELTYSIRLNLDIEAVAGGHGVEYSLDDGEVTVAPSSPPYVVEKSDIVIDAPTSRVVSLQVDEESESALNVHNQVDAMDVDCSAQGAEAPFSARMNADIKKLPVLADPTDESLQLTGPTLPPSLARNTKPSSCAQAKPGSSLNPGKRRREESQARTSEITRVLKKPFVSPLRPSAWLDNVVPTPIASAPEPPTAVETQPVLNQPRVMTRRLAKPFKPPHSASRSAQSNTTIRSLEDRVRLLRQAVRFQTQPDEDARLEELISRWRVAGREIAERLFSCVPKPEDSGVPQWQGYNPLPLDRSTDAIMSPADDSDAQGSNDEESEATVPPSWSYGTMLMQMGVDPSLLGWNENEEDWFD